MLLFMSICLLIYIPHTSIQDLSIPINEGDDDDHHHLSRRAVAVENTQPIERLIQWLTEQQYQYETAYYALTLNNVFPNFAKLFHERSESKYEDIKGLIRLCQILNLDINLQFIASNFVSRPLRLLSPESLNKTNFAQFFSDLKSYECDRTVSKLSEVYRDLTNISVPLQMYLKEKFYTKQSVLCKMTSDLFTQLDRFIDTNSNDRSLPFSLLFLDSRVNIIVTK